MDTLGNTILCLTCKTTGAHKIRENVFGRGSAQHKLYFWQKKLAVFWGRHRILFLLTGTAVIWLCIALIMAFYPILRPYTLIPLVIAVLITSLREFVPLAPLPYNVFNSVTSNYDKYSTAAMVSLASLGVALVYGLLIRFSEQFFRL